MPQRTETKPPMPTAAQSQLKATQSISRRATGVVSALASGLQALRISPSDELQLACRLAECRRDLLALALLTPEGAAELSSVRTELASGLIASKDLVERGSEPATPAEFEAWLHDVQQLQLDAVEAMGPTRNTEASSWPAGEWESLLARAAALVAALELDKDLVSRLLSSAGASGPFQAPSSPPFSAGVTRLPPLGRRSARRLMAESDRIRSRFVSANQGLVTYVSQRYLGMGLSQPDLIQEGNIGLMRAIDKFDHRRGSRFGTYAIWWIRQGIRRALANQARTIRVPVHALGTRYTLDQATRRLTLQRGRQPSEAELAEATGILPSSISQVMNLVREPLSLDAPRAGETELSLGDSLTDPSATNAVEEAVNKQRSEQVRDLITSLSPREQAMVRLRFGLDGADECTLEQIGQRYALTRERVRQIVTAALQKLQRQSQQERRELSSINE